MLFLYDRSFLTAITFACAGAHELGHMAAARLCGVGITGMTLYPFGADIRLDSPLRSYRKDFFISSAGIAVNLALAAISRAIPAGEVGRALIYVNLTLAAANIVPIDGLDGGGMLRAGMSLVFSPVAAARGFEIHLVCRTVDYVGSIGLHLLREEREPVAFCHFLHAFRLSVSEARAALTRQRRPLKPPVKNRGNPRIREFSVK